MTNANVNNCVELKQTSSTEESDRLILSNMGFVKAVARKYKSKFPSIDVDDLIQAGNVGLIEAARRFSKKLADEQGVQFTTYAYQWIRKYIIQECEKFKYKLHVPDKVRRGVVYKNNIKAMYEQLLGREPSFDEMLRHIQADMRITEGKARRHLRNIGMAEAEVYSLDKKIDKDSNTTFADVIEDPDRIEHTIEDLLPKEMESVLSTLTPREKRVLEIRFGIGTGKAYTLEEVGREFRVSAQRISQIEAKALRKLRHPSRSRKLKVFIDET